jgi:hypothetical protein
MAKHGVIIDQIASLKRRGANSFEATLSGRRRRRRLPHIFRSRFVAHDAAAGDPISEPSILAGANQYIRGASEQNRLPPHPLSPAAA